jgi:hypothetical protein
MSTSNWINQAKQLSIGKSIRIQCCKSDKSCIISNGNSGYGAYCFRCGFKDFEPHGEKSIPEILKGKAELELKRSRHIEIPKDCVELVDAPEKAQLWILKSGVSLEEAISRNIKYSPDMNRIILPVYESGLCNLQYIQARALGNDLPKYINSPFPTDNLIFWNCYDNKYVVIVEDILSAIKVGNATEQSAASILGTNFTSEKAYKIATEFDKIYLWFDNDDAGHRCNKEALKQLSLQGIEDIQIIQTEYDPKKYSSRQIRRIIEEQS